MTARYNWKVTGTGERDGETENQSFTVTTASMDDEAAADEFRNLVRGLGFSNPSVDNVRLLGEG